MREINEEKILIMLKKNPGEGISLALDAYGGAVKTICRNILFDLSTEDVEEAISDTFFKLWKSVDKYKKERNCSLKSYVYGIARHTALDKRRSMKKEISVLPIEETVIEASIDVEGDFARKLNNSIVHDSVNSMEEPIRSIFILRYFYYEKINTIAEKLGLSGKTVENHLHRGKTKLKENLIERGIQYEQ